MTEYTAFQWPVTVKSVWFGDRPPPPPISEVIAKTLQSPGVRSHILANNAFLQHFAKKQRGGKGKARK